MAINYPLINSRKYDHAAAEIQIKDRIFPAVASLKWDESLEPGKGYGARPEKLYRTTGQHDATGSFSLPLEDFADLLNTLGNGYMAVSFNIVANYSNEGQANTKVALIGCRITKHAGGSESGSDPAMEECDIDIMRVEINGLRAVPGMLV